MNYEEILKEGERFWAHNRRTMIEIKDAINVMEISGRLPNCVWEEMKSWHATNYSSFYNLTKRFMDKEYPDTIGLIKPSLSLLEWVYEGMIKEIQ